MKIHFITILVFVFFSCNSIQDEAFKSFHESYSEFNLDRFVLKNIQKGSWSIDYNLYTIDSLESLTFVYYTEPIENIKKGEVRFISYCKKQKINDLIYVESFNSKGDLLYSFKNKTNRFVPDNDAEFIEGKYYYYYKFKLGELTNFQREYFESNKDSIITNRINEIP